MHTLKRTEVNYSPRDNHFHEQPWAELLDIDLIYSPIAYLPRSTSTPPPRSREVTMQFTMQFDVTTRATRTCAFSEGRENVFFLAFYFYIVLRYWKPCFYTSSGNAGFTKCIPDVRYTRSALYRVAGDQFPQRFPRTATEQSDDVTV